MTPGPAIIDVGGLALTETERTRLRHGAVGGVILFARNFRDRAQLLGLVAEIRALRADILVCVDHEGGRVQRFRGTGFSALPPMRRLGELWDRDREGACRAAHGAGLVIAAELGGSGTDFSFAPVLDLDYGRSQVIGDRAFHADARAVGELAAAFIRGLAEGGMGAVGKHFPGHGYCAADSHTDVPVDERGLEEILARDLAPYRDAIAAGLAGVMPAHVIYPAADEAVAGFSAFWLQEILRGRLGFDGLIFSDDLSMQGASGAGSVVQRARAALAAGCDMVLLCNAPQEQEALLDGLGGAAPVSATRFARLRLRPDAQPPAAEAYRAASAALRAIA